MELVDHEGTTGLEARDMYVRGPSSYWPELAFVPVGVSWALVPDPCPGSGEGRAGRGESTAGGRSLTGPGQKAEEVRACRHAPRWWPVKMAVLRTLTAAILAQRQNRAGR